MFATKEKGELHPDDGDVAENQSVLPLPRRFGRNYPPTAVMS
jgi:hypothetical protein